MIHEQRSDGYRQRMVVPAVAASAVATVTIDVVGRLVGTGRFDLTQDPQRHALHVVQQGAGLVRLGDELAEVGPGDAFVFRPGVPVHYREDPGDPWSYVWCGLAGPGVDALLDELGFAQTAVRQAVASPALWSCFDDLFARFTADACGPFDGPQAAWRLAGVLAAGGPAPTADPAAQLRAIIDSGYDASLGVDALARRLGVDRSTLYRRFTRAYGTSPQRYLQARRLDRARLLLERGDQPVWAVAAAVGYADHRAFARAFRQRFGVNPSSLV